MHDIGPILNTSELRVHACVGPVGAELPLSPPHFGAGHFLRTLHRDPLLPWNVVRINPSRRDDSDFQALLLTTTPTMSKPTKPLNISSPRQQTPDELSGSPGRFNYGTPSLRAPGQTPSTPPIANIPRYGSPSGLGLPGSLTANVGRGQVPFRPRTPVVGSGVGSAGGGGTPVFPAFVGGGGGGGGSGSGAGSGTSTPRNLEEVPSEEMARVLRRHLVSREERQRLDDENVEVRGRSGVGSRRASVHSSGGTSRVQRENSEPFPIPYNAPGGDITCVPKLFIYAA